MHLLLQKFGNTRNGETPSINSTLNVEYCNVAKLQHDSSDNSSDFENDYSNYTENEDTANYKSDPNERFGKNLQAIIKEQEKKIADMAKKIEDRDKYQAQFEILKQDMQKKESKKSLEESTKLAIDIIKRKGGGGRRAKNKETKLNSKNRDDDEWDIGPDTTKRFVGYSNPDSDDATIMAIVNFRKKKNGVPEMLLEWSCGSFEWHVMDNVWKDAKDMVIGYSDNHGLKCVKEYVKKLEQDDLEEEADEKRKQEQKKGKKRKK